MTRMTRAQAIETTKHLLTRVTDSSLGSERRALNYNLAACHMIAFHLSASDVGITSEQLKKLRREAALCRLEYILNRFLHFRNEDKAVAYAMDAIKRIVPVLIQSGIKPGEVTRFLRGRRKLVFQQTLAPILKSAIRQRAA